MTVTLADVENKQFTWAELAADIWPCASYIRGDGPFATIRGCGDQTTIYLWPTLEQARSAMRRIHVTWGHHICQLKHVLIALDGWK